MKRENYNTIELMAIVASREIEDRAIIYIGTGIPMLAALEPGPNGPIDFVLNPAIAPTPTPPPTGFGRIEGICVPWQDPNIPGPAKSVVIGIPGVTIRLFEANPFGDPIGEPVAETVSGDNGQFLFEQTPAGLYIDVARKDGFERDVQLIGVRPDQTSWVRFVMKELVPGPTPPFPEPGSIAGRVLAAATEDDLGLAGDSITLYETWRRARLPVELHMYRLR